MADELEPVVFKVLAEIQDAQQSIQQVRDELTSMASDAQTSSSSIDSSLGDVGSALAAAASAAVDSSTQIGSSLSDVTGALQETADSVNDTQTQFEDSLGSVQTNVSDAASAMDDASTDMSKSLSNVSSSLESTATGSTAYGGQIKEVMASVGVTAVGAAAEVVAANARIDASLIATTEVMVGTAAKARAAGAEIGEAGHEGSLGFKEMAEAAGAFAAIDFLKDSVQEAAATEASLTLLGSAIEDSGANAKQFASSIEEAEAHLRDLGFANGQTIDGIARLTQMTKDAAVGINLQGLAADVARGRNIDFSAAIKIVGAAATGHVAALGKMGLATKDAAGDAISARTAVNELAGAFGGAADAYSGTAKGQFESFSAEMGDIKDKVGTALIPALVQLQPILLQVANVIANDIIPALVSAAEFYQNNKDVIDGLIVTVAAFLLAYKGVTTAIRVGTAVTKAYTTVMKLWKLATTTQTAAQLELDAALVANPIGIVIAAVVALVAVFVYAWKHSETFRNIVTGAWAAISKGIGHAVAAIINYYIRPMVSAYMWMAEKIVSAADAAFGWIPGLGGKLDDAKNAVRNFAHDTDSTLANWANTAEKWGNKAGDGVKKGTTKDTTKPPKPPNYGAGVSNAQAHAAEVKKHHDAATKHHQHHNSSQLEKQRKHAAAVLAAQKKHDALMLAEAKAAAAAQAAVLKKQLAEMEQKLNFARAQQEAQNIRDVLFVNNQLANVGTSMLNLGYAGTAGLGRGAPAPVVINVAGSVISQQELVGVVQQGLLVTQRTNSSLGIQPAVP